MEFTNSTCSQSWNKEKSRETLEHDSTIVISSTLSENDDMVYAIVKTVSLRITLYLLTASQAHAIVPFAFWKTQIKIIQTTPTFRSSATNPAVSFTAAPKAGNRVIVMLWGWSNDYTYTTGTVADNQGNTYTRAAANNYGVNFGMGIFISNPIGTPSGTFTVTMNPTITGSPQTGGALMEVSGLSNDPSITDRTSCSSGLTAAPTSNATATTILDNELLIATAVGGRTNPMTWTPGAGWTTEATETDSSTYQGGQAVSRIVNAKAAYTHTWTLSPSDVWAACIATFKGF